MAPSIFLSFAGRVVLVTGAGGGLGREYALEFARRGAKVVVNDLGGSASGSGSGSARPADTVVSEIQSAGGTAVPNYDSVEDGESIIAHCIRSFNRIDVIVNNAGILRDKSMLKMSDADWDLVHRIHLRAAYSISRAAWPHMRKQGYGRIIVTSSNSGIYGNFGQANYSAAKMGLIGLANTLAREGAKYNIQTNALVPTAATRLTGNIMPEETLIALNPIHVQPLVVWLCSEQCEESGGVFEAAAGWFGKLAYFRSKGVKLASHTTAIPASPEAVRDYWPQIIDMTGSEHFTDMQSPMVLTMDDDKLVKPSAPSSRAVEGASPRAAIGHTWPENEHTFEPKDVQLYAVSIGASCTVPSDMKLLYENDPLFCAFPTFPVACETRNFIKSFMNPDVQIPGFDSFDPTKLLHGEQYLEILQHDGFPTEGRLRLSASIVDMVDKKSGALMVTESIGHDAETGKKLFKGQSGVFLRGMGGFGGPRSSQIQIPTIATPTRSPDVFVEQVTTKDQAVIYRLASGDYNPLHIDPEFAAFGGFSAPILHGLCSMGFAARHVMNAFAQGDVSLFKAIKVRFSGSVIPGQTLVTRMWLGVGGTRVHFETLVKETGKPAISAAFLDFRSKVAIQMPGNSRARL